MWKEEYNETRRIKYAENEEYRKKRNKTNKTREERLAYNREYYRKNKHKWNKRTQEQRDRYNNARKIRYAEDKEYREQLKNKVKDYHKRNPKARIRTRLKKYGITPEQYNAILKAQNYGCAICGNKDCGTTKKERLHVDHCHITNKVRGLLCVNCNHGIGKFQDDKKLLQRAAKYLEGKHIMKKHAEKDKGQQLDLFGMAVTADA